MARTCTVCAHPKRAEIDAALLAGASLRDITGRFGPKKSALDRHRAHIPQALAKAKETADVVQAETQLSEMQRLRDEARTIGRSALQKGNEGTALQAIREQTRIIEVLVAMAEVAAKNKPPDGADIDLSGRSAEELDALARLDDDLAAQEEA